MVSRASGGNPFKNIKQFQEPAYRVFSHDVTTARLVSQNNETAAIEY